MTPQELYHLYRFDEPTRYTQDYLNFSVFTATPGSVPIIEQTLPWAILRERVLYEAAIAEAPKMRIPRTKRRRR